jgi:hypothetical protein
MVEQTQASPPGALSGTLRGTLDTSLSPSRRFPPIASTLPEPVLTAPRLLVVMMIALLIPGNFTVAGAQFSPYRILILCLLPYLGWRWLKGDAGKQNAVDILMLLCTIWVALALLVNHGIGSVSRSVMFSGEIFGGYLFGRLMIRNTADYRRWFTLLTWGFVFLMPFAVFELLTGKNLIRAVFDIFFDIPPRQSNLRPRFGLVRAQTVFEHPILFGLVGSMAFANVLYIYRDRFTHSVRLVAFFVFMVFTTISSGPMLSILIQASLTAWDRVFWFMRLKWFVLGFVLLMSFMLLKIASQFHIIDFVIEHLMFNPQTADGRLVNLEYGSQEIVRHPIFGIGMNEWVRPWYKPPSFDNFWLNHAMRFGLPSAGFLVLAIVVSAWRIVTETTLDRRESSYRTGYLIALAGLVVVLGTVYIWSATWVFFSIYIGAGAIFYMRETEAPTDRDRARRAAQARALAGAGPYPAPGTPPRPGLARGSAAREAAAETPRGEAGRIPAGRAPRARRGVGPLATDTGRRSGDSRHV